MTNSKWLATTVCVYYVKLFLVHRNKKYARKKYIKTRAMFLVSIKFLRKLWKLTIEDETVLQVKGLLTVNLSGGQTENQL